MREGGQMDWGSALLVHVFTMPCDLECCVRLLLCSSDSSCSWTLVALW